MGMLIDTPEKFEKRQLELDVEKQKYYARKHKENPSGYWLVQATKAGVDCDYLPEDAGNYPNDEHRHE